jgi:hypothetical protein
MVNVLISLIGAYILIDGIVNIFIKGKQHHSLPYDFFRGVRALLGLALIIIGIYL